MISEWRFWLPLAFFVSAGCSTWRAHADLKAPQPAAASAEAASGAWQDLQYFVQPPAPPPEWQTKRPTPQAIADWELTKLRYAEVAADLAKKFYLAYSGDQHAAEARDIEYRMLETAVELGDTDRVERLAALDRIRLADPHLAKDERFALMIQIMARKKILTEKARGTEAAMVELESGVRDLQRLFPESTEIYPMLMTVAAQTEDPQKARCLAEEIISGPADPDLKASARTLLHWLDRLGKPLNLSFTAVDGRKVDLKTMRGKVVMVYFWASWCSYCTEGLPVVKAAYENLHDRGFEIVGVNYDASAGNLAKFLADNKILWPQYNDGKGRNGVFAKEFEVFEIPTLWLVDKRGCLRETDVREGLAKKVELLLAEK
jgi:thiol-disulfide isomerase/thioredoxin